MTSTRLSTLFAIYADPTAYSSSPHPYSSSDGLDTDPDTDPDTDTSDLLPEEHLTASVEPCPDPRTAHSPRRTSAMTTTTSISSLPPELLPGSGGAMPPYTPMKARPPFRNPSSVRALQMSSPPPFTSPRHARSRDGTPSSQRVRMSMSRAGTPTSVRSSQRRLLDSGARRARAESAMAAHHHHHHPDDPASAPACEEKNKKKNHPLVLLHATVLPHVCPYSPATLRAVLPAWMLENHRLLAEKTSALVLGRGILIPHPGEEYDLLEERLLESLELRPPRILRCGHFHAVDESETEGEEEEEEREEEQDRATVGRASRRSSRDGGSGSGNDDGDDDDDGVKVGDNTDDDSDTCPDCLGPIKRPHSGAGTGKRRWDVRIYAANGLMRAGAWAAAWREMERVDVEIGPWIPEGLRRELDRRREVEEAEAEAEAELRRADMVDRARAVVGAGTSVSSRRGGEVRERSFVASPIPILGAEARQATSSQSVERPRTPTMRPGAEIPLATLLGNYVYLLAQDRRNIAVFVLSLLVLLLAMRSGHPREAPARLLSDVVLTEPLAGQAAHPLSLTVAAMAEQSFGLSGAALADATPTVLGTNSGVECAPPVTITETVVLTKPQEASGPAAAVPEPTAMPEPGAGEELSADGSEEPSLSQSLVGALERHVNVLAGDEDANVLDDLASPGGAVDVGADEVQDMLS